MVNIWVNINTIDWSTPLEFFQTCVMVRSRKITKSSRKVCNVPKINQHKETRVKGYMCQEGFYIPAKMVKYRHYVD